MPAAFACLNSPPQRNPTHFSTSGLKFCQHTFSESLTIEKKLTAYKDAGANATQGPCGKFRLFKSELSFLFNNQINYQISHVFKKQNLTYPDFYLYSVTEIRD